MNLIFSQAAATASASPSASPSPSTEPAIDLAPPNLDKFVQDLNSTFDMGFWNTLIYAAIVIGITLLVLRLMNKFIKPRFLGNSRIFYRLIVVFVLVIAVLSIIVTIRPLRELAIGIFASSGIVAVVVGIAAQSTMANLFAGISISMGKPFNVGEFVEILGTSPTVTGIVTEITLRHTIIRDPESKLLVVPNSILDKSMLRSTRFLEGGSVCSFLFVNIAYDSDMDKATKILQDLAEAHPNTEDSRTEEQKAAGVPKTPVFMTQLGEYFVQLRASIWTEDTAKSFETLSALRYDVLKRFKEEGIIIPCPTMNINSSAQAEEFIAKN